MPLAAALFLAPVLAAQSVQDEEATSDETMTLRVVDAGGAEIDTSAGASNSDNTPSQSELERRRKESARRRRKRRAQQRRKKAGRH